MADVILFDWPYLGIAGGIAGIAWLLASRRPAGAPSRWRDPAWLACTVLPMYMLHQFEEHGIDALGRHYQFIEDMCSTLGHPDLASCPADPWFILAVNAGAVWIAGATAIVWRRRNPMVGAATFGIPLVNGVAHVAPAVIKGQYNAGLLTAVVLFLPFGIYVMRTLVREGVMPLRRVPVVVLTGVALHAVLAGGLLAYGAGVLPYGLMLAIQVLNGLLPLAFGTLFRVAPAAD
jgi:hypothetical protein